jgi:RNA polymerase sigma-70 factor, ECF subfamily
MNDGSINAEWCEHLYERKASGLILYGRALGLSHWEAEDVLQSTFESLLRLMQPPQALDHYCVRAYRNRAINYRRSLWRRVLRELESKTWFESKPATNEPERTAMAALEQLPHEQREVIVLKIWHGYTFEQIGELLSVSPNTVAGRYRYGMQKLRAKMESREHENTDEFRTPNALVEVAPTDPIP